MSTLTDTRIDESLLLGQSAHYICCEDENMALCGLDRTGRPWTSIPITCTDCIVNDNRGHCPLIKGSCTWGKDKYGDDE